MKKITEEDAKKVSGGSEFRNGKTFSGWVGQYDGIRGNYYFVIHDREENWFAGWMLDTWEKDGYKKSFRKSNNKENNNND